LCYEYANAIYDPVVARTVGARPDGRFASAFRGALRRALALDSTITPAYFALAQAAIASGDTTEARQHLQAYQRFVEPESSTGDRDAELVSLEGALHLAYGDSIQQANVIRQFESGSYPAGGRFLGGALPRDPTADALRAQGRIGDVFVERNGLYTFRTIAWLRAGRYDELRSFIQDTTYVSASARLSRLEAATRLVSRQAMHARDVPRGLAAPLCRADAPLLYRLMGCYRQARLAMLHEPDLPGQPSVTVQNARAVLQELIPGLEQAGNVDLSNVARGYVASLDGLTALRAGQTDAHSVLDSAHVHLVPFEIFGGEWEAMESQLKALIETGDPSLAQSYAHVIASTDPYGHYLAGRAYEALGDMDAAGESYARFTSGWRDADADLPPLKHAQAVLAGEAPAAASPL